MNPRHPVLMNYTWGWFALPVLLVGAAICLLKYAGWSAVTSGHYGLPGQTGLVANASHTATVWLWALIGVSVLATVLTVALLRFSDERFSPGFRGTIRVVLALFIVAGGTFGIGELLATIGHHLH